jgi:hypothetical protein
MMDSELKITDNTISLKGEESKVRIVLSYDLVDDIELSGSLALLKHLAERYGYLMLAAKMFYGVGEDFCNAVLRNLPADTENGVMAFIDFATLEMLNFSDEYELSKDFCDRLLAMRKQNRAELDVKNEYAVGDIVTFDYCGGDATSLMNGKVIFADKHHAIVQVPCYTYQLAAGINRDTMPLDQVETIVGKPISEIKQNEYDCFVDMYNALTFLPCNISKS